LLPGFSPAPRTGAERRLRRPCHDAALHVAQTQNNCCRRCRAKSLDKIARVAEREVSCREDEEEVFRCVVIFQVVGQIDSSDVTRGQRGNVQRAANGAEALERGGLE